MRSIGATHNLFAISSQNKETAINTEQSTDLTLLSDIGDTVNLIPRRESNEDEANGMEEANVIYDNGATSETTRNHNKAQPQHFAYLLAFGLGNCASVASGSGYVHTITPISRALDLNRELPSFTALCRYGDMVAKRLLVSMFVDSVTATFAKDDWVKVVGNLKGTGKHEDNVVKERVTANGDATSLNVPTAVHGANQAERTDNIHRIRVELTAGVWTEVAGISSDNVDATLINFTSPGGAVTPVTYEVLYVKTEAAKFTFPAKVAESPLRVSEMTLNLGGTWDGSAFTGGKSIGRDINSLQYSLSNSSAISFVPGGGGAFASDHEKNRMQTIKADRKLRDWILQQHIKDNDTFGCQIVCMGAEFAPGENYQVKFTFPMLGVVAAPITVNGQKLAEAGDLKVLEDATYGSVIVEITNQWSSYAQ